MESQIDTLAGYVCDQWQEIYKTSNKPEYTVYINCLSIAAYLFLLAGQIDGLNPVHLMGMEMDPRKPSMADQTQYLWSVTDDGSLIMNSISQAEPVIWSSIAFLDDDQIQVDSSTRGPLHCYRGLGGLPGRAS